MEFRKSIVIFVLVGLIAATSAQRGCPMVGCDPRGTFCQADFKVNTTEVSVAWRIKVGEIILNRYSPTVGCVGNAANIICSSPNSNSSLGSWSYASITSDGKVRWYDNLLTNPGLPVMDAGGDIIANDGFLMEMRKSTGEVVGKVLEFDKQFPVSDVYWVQNELLFFFLSHHLGGMFLYDNSGMCVASYYINEKDPETNATSTWIPLNKPIINTDIDPPTVYVIMQNNSTEEFRLYAVAINHQPPYLWQKWFLDFDNQHQELTNYTMAEVPLLAIGSYVFVGIGNRFPSSKILIDEGTKAVLKNDLDIYCIGYSVFSTPSDKKKRTGDVIPIVWMSSMEGGHGGFAAKVIGWDSKDGGHIKYEYNLSEILGLQTTIISTNVMVFGYHEEETTLVFAVSGLNWSGATSTNPQGNYLMAFQPNKGTSEDLLFMQFMGDSSDIIGQIIGVSDDTLIALNFIDDGSEIIGFKLNQKP